MGNQNFLSQASFITFEGCECSGKSTQSKLLYEWFIKNNKKAVLTKEPGGTETADELRRILLNKATKLNFRSELMLHMASRIEHVTDVIIPNLKTGINVVCDRFLDSTVAYQGYGHGISVDLIKQLHKTFLDDIQPSTTFVFDLKFNVFKERIEKKNKLSPDTDRYETFSEDFHKKVIKGFKDIAQQNSDRCILIDASDKSIQAIHKNVLQHLASK